MLKISTGWRFYLDVEESGNLYISEGKGTRRTQIKLADLNAFSWTTRESIKFVLEHLLNSNTESKPTPEEIFYFYKQVLSDHSSLIHTPYHKWDSETNRLYKKIMIEGIWESAHFQYEKSWESPNPYDNAINNPERTHIIMVRWESKWDCWYADFVFDGEAWGFNCLDDASTYQIDDGSYKLNLIDEETNKIDTETQGYKICDKLKAELESAVKCVAKKEDGKSGSWIYVPRYGYAYRKWSEIPELWRINLFVAAGESTNYYDDIEELDFTPEDDPENPDMARLMDGCCRYKYHHPDESDEDNDSIEND